MFPGNIELEPAPAVEPIPVENEPEPESLWLVVLKEPKSDSKGDSKAGITPALIVMQWNSATVGIWKSVIESNRLPTVLQTHNQK